jgi:hypothetical protein
MSPGSLRALTEVVILSFCSRARGQVTRGTEGTHLTQYKECF